MAVINSRFSEFISDNGFELVPRFKPRPYQVKFLEAMDSGVKRAILVWHRRAGKDKCCWALAINRAFSSKIPGSYVILFPTTTLARRVLWDAIDSSGMRFLDMIPKGVLKKKPNQTTMKIEFISGSSIQLLGTDNIESAGTNPLGVIFSEYSLHKPSAWTYIRPILLANGGWAVFNFTPRGKNHAYELFRNATGWDDWLTQYFTVDDTNAIPKEEVELELRRGMPEGLWKQEYYCSFDQGVGGSYYARLIHIMQEEGRITKVPLNVCLPVNTYWDLGRGYTVTLFVQKCNEMLHIIDMAIYEQKSLADCVRQTFEIQKARKFTFGEHFAPHDMRVRDWSADSSRESVARDLGLDFSIIGRSSRDEGIEKAMCLFPKVVIDSEHCMQLVKALEAYRRSYNKATRSFGINPHADWSSHPADAFRLLACEQRRNLAPSITPDRIRQLENKHLGSISSGIRW